MSGLLGKIDYFDPELEEWSQYVERLEQFFMANRIVGEEKTVDFPLSCGTRSLQVATQYSGTSQTHREDI